MKIKEVLLKEMGSRGAVPTPANPGYQVDPSGPANIGNQSFTGMQGQATQKAAPKKAAPKKAAAPTGGKVPPQPTLNGQPSTGPKGQAWLKKYGATHNPDGTPKAAASATAPAPAATGQDAPSAELDRLKQLAIGGSQPPATAAAPAAPEPAAPTPAPNVNALGIAQAANVANPLQPTPQADASTGQATQPAEKPAEQPAAQPAPGEFTPVPSGYNTTAPAVTDRSGNQVKTGTGGTLTSRSDDELAWASKQPMGGTGQQYPGAGNWDPKTGRDLKAAAQGEKNWQSIKNFFGGKKQPAAQPATQGQATQPAPTASPGAAGALAAMRESDDAVLSAIRNIR
jgi:translation initiation factor IF-2